MLVRYTIQNTAYSLTESAESPILSYDALCAVVRWVRSRYEPTQGARGLGESLRAETAGSDPVDCADGQAGSSEPAFFDGDR